MLEESQTFSDSNRSSELFKVKQRIINGSVLTCRGQKNSGSGRDAGFWVKIKKFRFYSNAQVVLFNPLNPKLCFLFIVSHFYSLQAHFSLQHKVPHSCRTGPVTTFIKPPTTKKKTKKQTQITFINNSTIQNQFYIKKKKNHLMNFSNNNGLF